MPPKPASFNAATKNHKKLTAAAPLTIAGGGESAAKPKVVLWFWALGGHVPLKRTPIQVPAANITYAASKFTFTTTVRHGDLLKGYNHLAIMATDQDTNPDFTSFRVIGPPASLGFPLEVAAEMAIDKINGGTDFNDVDPSANLVVDGSVVNNPGGMTAYVCVYGYLGAKAALVACGQGSVGTNDKYQVDLGAVLQAGQGYTIIATANVEHIPASVGIFTSS
jgi:hypothetical protein